MFTYVRNETHPSSMGVLTLISISEEKRSLSNQVVLVDDDEDYLVH